MSNSFDLDSAQRSVGHDLVQIVCKSYQQTTSEGKELICNLLKVIAVLFFHRYLVIALSIQVFYLPFNRGDIFYLSFLGETFLTW